MISDVIPTIKAMSGRGDDGVQRLRISLINSNQLFFAVAPSDEIVTSFCLISGGITFMLSNKDTVAATNRYGLNAMSSFTLTMGFTA